MIRLEHGAQSCAVSARFGSLLGWWASGQPLLRAARQPLSHPHDAASFPLVPYSNRIRRSAFCWRGVKHNLRPNAPPSPNAIHGTGWQRDWQIVRRSRAMLVLALDHTPDADWPFAFRAKQIIGLTDDGLTLTLEAENREAVPAPLAFGHHPYFDLSGAHLEFTAAAIWLTDIEVLPVSSEAPSGTLDFSAGAPVLGSGADNAFSGWDGRARIWWEGRPFGLRIEADRYLPAAVVYAPPDEGFFCFEPIPHLPDALNRPDLPMQMPVIAPGEAFATTVRFQLEPS